MYASQSGASARLAHAAFGGAKAEIDDVRLLRCADAGAREVAASKGVLLVCAENSGRLAGQAKDFLDRIFYPLHLASCCRPYALLVSAGNDGTGAVAEAQRIMSGIPFTRSVEPLIIRGPASERGCGQARELGAAFAAGLSMGVF
ncbi:MAG: flavodoxin [Pseudomonadota bacterium]